MEFLAIFFLSFIPRLIFLFFGIPSITHDEADFFLNSYYLSKTGSDIYDRKFFLTSGHLTITGGIPVYIGALSFIFFNKNIITGRAPYAILSIFTPIFFYLLIKKIFNKKLAFLSFLILNFSPWFLHMSTQAATEQIVSLFFLIAGYLFYSNNDIKSSILSYFLLFLSFHSYMGIKISFPFLIFTIFMTKKILENKLEFKDISKSVIKSIIFSVIALIPLYFLSGDTSSLITRSNNDLLFLNKNLLENKVWYERLTTNAPEILKIIYSNKITVLYKTFLEKYTEAFNLKTLFIIGDQHPIYGNSYPLFYPWQIIFFLIGFSFLIVNLRKDKRLTIPLLIIIFSPLPAALNIQPTTIALRSYPLIFSYSFLIAYGILNIFKKNVSLIFLSFLILLSFLNFTYIYNSRIKIISSEQWHLGEKKLFNKVLKEEKNKKIYIVNNEPKETFMLFSFYHIDNAKFIKDKIKTENFSYKNLVFTNKKISSLKDEVIIVKRDVQDIDKKIKEKMIIANPYLEASDKSGILYYLIKQQ